MSEEENFDSFLSDGLEVGGSDLEGYDEVVSGLAGGLYSELERLILAHGEGAVTGLMPLTVSMLETLEGVCAESRERGSELALAREENERLLAQYERERAKRKRTEERFLELEDTVENERKMQKSRLETAASQTRQMEMKARSYADMTFQLEEEKTSLEKDHKKLLQNYNVILRSLKELQVQYRLQQSEGARHSGSSTPRVNREKRAYSMEFSDGPSSLVSDPDQGYPESYSASEEPVTPITTETPADDPVVTSPVEKPTCQGPRQLLGDGAPTVTPDRELDTSGSAPENLSEVEGIIQTTPELHLSQDATEHPATSTPKSSEDEVAERNTDSILQELQSVGSEFIEELDEGADLLDLGCHVETFVSENAQLREKQTAMESARRSLIARVEELACEREELQHELGELQEAQSTMETRVKELEAALKRSHLEADEMPRGESDDADLPAAQRKRFTRAEMSRVITERNLYKERLMELQEAVRRSERMRALKEQRSPQTKKSSIWDRFNQLLGLSSVPPQKALSSRSPMGTLGPVPGCRSVPPVDLSPCLRRGSVKSFSSNDETSVESAKEQRREQYRLIRTHVWQEHGRSQAHGWSVPPKEAGETARGGPCSPLAVPVPALVQVRLLDQKDPSTKLWCATGVQLCEKDLHHLRLTAADSSTEPRGKVLVCPLSMVWICSGTHSETEVMVIDVGKANHVLDHFTIANCHVLCATSVPGFHDLDFSPMTQGELSQRTRSAPCSLSGSLASLESVGSEGRITERDQGQCTAQPGTEEDCDSASNHSLCSRDSVPAGDEEEEAPGARWHGSASPTIWLGSQSGRLFVHSSCSHWRRCLHSVRLKDCVHSIVYTRGFVVATLGNGTLTIFHRKADGAWDVTGYRSLDLGRPHQSVRCATPVADKVWCGYRNRIYVINPRAAKIEKWFEATPRAESQVRHLAWLGEGVWVSVRLDSALRLFHARSGQPLQEVDIQPFVSTMFGTGQLGLSFLQVSAMSVFYKRLWIGTGTGIVLSIPLSGELDAESILKVANGGQEDNPQGAGPSSSIPYCFMSHAQICFHGHRDAVRFFVAVSETGGVGGIAAESPGPETEGQLISVVMSGGEGYINFRIGDDTSDLELSRGTPVMLKPERSHLIVWQMKT